MTTIAIPAQAVIMIIAGRDSDRAMEVCGLLDGTAFPEPWSVNHPDESADKLKAAIGEHSLVRVYIRNSHAAARRQTAAIARRHGYASVVLRLPDAPQVDAAAEKIDQVFDIDGAQDLMFEFTRMPSDMTHLEGPFDILGDVHGCADELRELLTLLGHIGDDGEIRRHPEGRIPVLLGDLTDRGPKNLESLEIARALAAVGGLIVKGNHDVKVIRWLQGKEVEVKAGVDVTIAELEGTDAAWRADMAEWLSDLRSHMMLDGGRLAVAHAGISRENQGRHSAGAMNFGLYGKPLFVDGQPVIDPDGYPASEDWAQAYDGETVVVHGHVVHPEPRVVNGVHAIDTGCVFGGSLTAMRYPEMDYVKVKAHRAYYTSHGREVAAEADA